MTDLEMACRNVMRNHDALQKAYQAEPELPEDGGWSSDAHETWEAWCVDLRDPAYAKWDLSMDMLQRVAGDAFPGRHPMNFRPFCRMVLASPESFAGQR